MILPIVSTPQKSRLIENTGPDFYRTILMMVTFTGMRSGELLGLQWGDLQLPSGPDADGKVFVRRSLSWGRYRAEDEHLAPRFYEPKTKSGKREIPIPAALVRELKTWRLPRAPVAVRFSIPGAGRFAVSSERVELARIVARIEAG